MFKIRLLFPALLLLAAISAPAQEAGRLDYREATLANGLRVITLEDFSCPIVAVQVWYHVGSKDEDPERQGFAHMFEHMMFRGTDRLGSTGHFDYIRRVGGYCNGYTSFDQTVYLETAPANQLELMLWLEAERMSFLKIDQAAYDTERKVVEEERRLRVNAPYGTLMEQALPEMFKVHPYRWTPIGKIPHLRAASVGELRTFWQRYYGPANATLIIVGAVKHDDALACARRYFEWIPGGDVPPRIDVREPSPTAARDVTIKQQSAPAPLVGVVFRTVPLGHDDYVPLHLLSIILGEGSHARLERRLALHLKLAVSTACIDYCLEQDGIFGAGAVLTAGEGKMDKALAALKEEIEKTRTKKVTPRELEKAKNAMLKALVVESQQIGNKAAALGRAVVVEGDLARVNARLDAIRRMTAEDLQRVAQQYLAPDKATVFRVERNVQGMFKKGIEQTDEDAAPVTAQPETAPPPPGRKDAVRPAHYPAAAPANGLLDADPDLKFEARTLANGLRVVVVENHETPFVKFLVGLRAGSWSETKPGCANMALQLIGMNTRKRPWISLQKEAERFAIEISGSASHDYSSVVATAVSEHAERAAGMLSESVMAPRFKKKEFELLRTEVITALSVSSAEPSYLADRELARRLYGQHPYARAVEGTIGDVRALTREDLQSWWVAFARADMASLYISGDITMEKAVALAEKYFGGWRAQGEKPNVDLPAVPDPANTQIYLVDKAGSQSQIRIGQRGLTRADPGWFTSRVSSGYFGEAFGSRLNNSLRVQKGLTYGAGGGFSARRMAGEFQVSTFTKIESTPEAVVAAIDEIRRFETDPPSQQELEDTKTYMLGSFAGRRELPGTVAEDLWLIEREALPPDYFRRYVDAVRSSQPQQCAQVATEALDLDKLVVVVVGPAAELKEKLEAIAPVTVIKPQLDAPETNDAKEEEGNSQEQH